MRGRARRPTHSTDTDSATRGRLDLAPLLGDDLVPDGSPSYSRKVIRDSAALLRSYLGMEVAFVKRFAEGRRWFEYVDADSAFCPIETGEATR